MLSIRFLALCYVTSTLLLVSGCAIGGEDVPANPPAPKTAPTPTDPTPTTPTTPTKPPACSADEKDCGGTCVSLMDDAANCGACGRDCGGGPSDCVEGRCLPRAIANGSPLSAFAIDDAHVYWTSRVPMISYCKLERASKNGSEVVTMHDSGATQYQNCSGALTVDRDDVLWGAIETFVDPPAYGAIRKMKKTDAAAKDLVEFITADAPGAIATDSTSVFFTGLGGGVFAIDRAFSGTTSTLAPKGTVSSAQLVSAGTYLYAAKFDSTWTSASLLQVEKTGGAPSVLFAGDKIYGLRVDGDDKLLYSTLKIIRGFDLTPRTKTDLAPGLGSVSSFAADKDHVYWADDSTGSVFQAARSGGTPILLATGFKNTCVKTCTDDSSEWLCAADGGPCAPHHFAKVEVDDKFVYFLDDGRNTTGYVFRVAKWRD